MCDEETRFAGVADCPKDVPVKYEYLDHTADVQLHAWGDRLEEAFEQVAVAMFNYATDVGKVDAVYTYDIEAHGDDLPSLLFQYLNEWLYAFCAEPYFVAKAVRLLSFDRAALTVKARGWGESFDLAKHTQGTEIKAITYSNMQVHDQDEPPKHEVFVIIDI